MKTSKNFQTKDTVHFPFCLLMSLLLVASSAFSQDGLLDVAIVPQSQNGGLYVLNPDSPEDTLNFGSCEGVIDGDEDFGLFLVRLEDTPNSSRYSWQLDEGLYSYQWQYLNGLLVKYNAKPLKDNLQFVITLVNMTDSTLNRPSIHFCLKTTKAHSFYPAGDYKKLYDRSILWSDTEPFRFAETEFGHDVLHLAIMSQGQPSLNWGWWTYSLTKAFDIPLLAITSIDNQSVFSLVEDDALWASVNTDTGTDWACVHLFPFFGRMEVGKAVSVAGKLYRLKGTQETAYGRYVRDSTYFRDLKAIKQNLTVDGKTFGQSRIGEKKPISLSLNLNHDGLSATKRLYLDFTDIAEPAEIPFVASTDGHYSAEGEIVPNASAGRYAIPVVMDIAYDNWESQIDKYHLAGVVLDIFPKNNLGIYGDGLASTWRLSPFKNMAIDTACTTVVHAGEFSQAISLTSGSILWYKCIHPQEIKLFGYSHLQFYINSGKKSGLNPKVYSIMFDGPKKSFKLSDLGIALEAGVWKQVSIPISGKFATDFSISGVTGDTLYVDDIELKAATPSSQVEENSEFSHPADFCLFQNFPNPFNSNTTIEYRLLKGYRITLTVTNLLGQPIRHLTDGYKPAGNYRIKWEGRDDQGAAVPSAVYLYVLKANGYSLAQKMAFVR
jgi:hypothetical protein